MWNKIAPALEAGGAPPRPGMPPQGGAAPPSPMPQAPPPPAAAPPMAAGAPAPAQHQPGTLPPEFQQHVDPNNPIQAALIARALHLRPEQSQAFAAGTDVPALNVLKILVPELGFLWDTIIQKKSAQGAASPMPNQPPGAPAPPLAQPPAAPPQRLAAQRFQ